MINRHALLADLQKFLIRIEADLLERSESTEVPEVPAALHVEYEKAAKAERTAQNYEDWRTDTITQAAAAWVLSCVFVRFLEDNSLIDPPKIAGPGERLARARDEHELYFRSHPQHTDREYLLSIFDELAKLPGTKDIFGEHNAINDLPNWLSGDAAGELLNFFQKIDASTGDLVHDFTDPNWDTRFLGDLYQDLSEAARKKFALLQTPDFVEEFILDRTLEPAIEEFGLVPQSSGTEEESAPRFKMIDPACGSGHFLLGAFPRLLERWQRKEPGTNTRELTQRALDSIHGVDINPFAVAIAKFRLLLVAMQACNIKQLADSPGFRVHVACGDSLLHGENRTSTGQKLWDYAEGASDDELYAHSYPGENLQTVRELLKPNSYHCVVANPPYIVPKDRKLNEWYRKRFSACHMKYSLAVPFMQQMFQLSVHGGLTGQITANSFMKREFGKKLIEIFFPRIELTHVVDTKGAFIPGHGTPTVIVLGKNRAPICATIRTIMGVRAEPFTPSEPAKGKVWTSIEKLIDQPGVANEFISVADYPRDSFTKHPWSIGGGGASELKATLDSSSTMSLKAFVQEIGVFGITAADDVMFASEEDFNRFNVSPSAHRPLISGDEIRDWTVAPSGNVLFPYDSNGLLPLEPDTGQYRWLWPFRTLLWSRATFSQKTYKEDGRTWWEWHQTTLHRLRSPLSLVFSFVATHNHFVLDRGGKVFNRSAPLLKLKDGADERTYLKTLALLNSSTAGFWFKQVMQPKQMTAGDGVRIESACKVPHEFATTQMGNLPLPELWNEDTASNNQLGDLASEADKLASVLCEISPLNAIRAAIRDGSSLKEKISQFSEERQRIRSLLILVQEEIDFLVYSLYGLMPKDDGNVDLQNIDPVGPGDRPFCILAQKNEDSFHVPCVVPENWSKRRKIVWESRIQMIKANELVGVIENANYKRRWIGRQGKYNHIQNSDEVAVACLEWMVRRLESYFDLDGRMDRESFEALRGSCGLSLGEIAMYSVAQLADTARRDPQFMEVGELYRDDPAFDVQALVEELVLAESVPHLPSLRYKDSGLRKRAEWEKTWELQRREDDIDAELKSAQESLKLAEQCVRERFKSELEELGKMRARLLEATTQAYIDLGKEVPLYEPQYEAEIHAGVLLNHIGIKKMTTAMALNSAKDAVFKYQLDLDHKIRLACDEDITVLKCHSRLRAIPDKPDISVPPKYTSADFISTGGARYWSLRGKLDVPKERWISFPHCEGPDGTLVICWAGYDHLQQAQAISAYYVRVQTEFGGSDDPRLIPLLASLIQLLPWLKQWHNEPNANFDGLRMGDYFEGFVNEEARNLGKTLDEIKSWKPPARATSKKRKKAT